MKLTALLASRRHRLMALAVLATLSAALWLLVYTPLPRPRLTSRSEPASPAPAASASGSGTATARIDHYRSSMVPGEISATPRKDSMGMDMIPVYANDSRTLELTSRARAMAGVDTAPAQRRPVSRELRAVGKVRYNESALATITSRVEGYIERLFVDFTGSDVNRGDHLVEIYSPDLLVAQQELLIALENQRSEGLVESARRKLILWGLTEAQVDVLVRDRKLSDRVTLYAPFRGTVTEKAVVQHTMVKPGEMLYRLANLDAVWVALDIYEFELPWVQYGQTAEFTTEAYPGKTFHGRVWLISPVLDEETRTISVLLNVDNRGRDLKPGMFVSAVLRGALLADGRPAPTGVEGQWTCPMHPLVVQPDGGACPVCGMTLVQIPGASSAAAVRPGDRLVLTVPVTAVVDSGTRKLVFVERTPGQFEPAEVVTGPRADMWYPILRGLNEGDRVAVRGAFLLDSQFEIRGLPSLFHPEGASPAASSAQDEIAPTATSPHAGHVPAPGAVSPGQVEKGTVRHD